MLNYSFQKIIHGTIAKINHIVFVKAILGVFLSFPSDHLFSLISTNNLEEMRLFLQKKLLHIKTSPSINSFKNNYDTV